MKIQAIAISLCLLILTGCDEEPKSTFNSPTNPISQTPSAEEKATKIAQNQEARNPIPDTHQCLLKGTILEDNSYWIKSAQTLVGIVANEQAKMLILAKVIVFFQQWILKIVTQY